MYVLRITTLIENSPGEHHGLKNEHGISFFIEKDGHKVLFDAGQSGAFLSNAVKMNIDLSDLEHVVLSHGHYDHSGGFRSLCGIAGDFTLWTGEGFFTPKYAFRNGAYDYLGNDFDESFLSGEAISHSILSAPLREILPGVFLLTNFPRIYPEERINPRFFLLRDGEFVQDSFDDEVLLAVETGEGLAVLLGCSHPGMRNMLDAVRERLRMPINAVLGGSHLVEVRGSGLEKSFEYLQNSDIHFVGVSHCTGNDAMERLGLSCPNFFRNVTGSSLFFGQPSAQSGAAGPGK